MEIKKITIHQIHIPLKIAFATAQFNRIMANNIVVKVETSEHIFGYGESVPRTYVTGEDTNKVVSVIKADLAPHLIGRKIENIEEAETALSQLSDKAIWTQGYCPSSALCALDLAILDATGHFHKRSVTALLGGDFSAYSTYSICIPLVDGEALNNILTIVKRYSINHVKVKVGSTLKADIERLRTVRRQLGESAEIWIDANCQWGSQEAIERINIFNEFKISCVEQPVAANNFSGLAEVKRNVTPAIIADESACSYADVQKLIALDACDIFNIKISKCGGLYNSLRIYKLIRDAGKACALGYHIGETGILEAAGRTFALVTGDLKYLEGSVSSLILKENIVCENLEFDEYGRAPALPQAGLGVTINENVLHKYTVYREEIN